MNGTTLVRVGVGANLSGAFAVLHTVYQARWLRVTNLHLVNVSLAAVTVNVCAVVKGGTPDVTNALLWGFSIPASDFIEASEGLMLPPGSSIQALCSTPGAINLYFSGEES